MKLQVLGPNQTEISRTDGTVIFFSYNTPVACYIAGDKEHTKTGYFKTEKKWSVTTSKYINKWLNGASATVKPQSFFDEL